MKKLLKMLKVTIKCIQSSCREFYLKHFKLHCPACGGVLDSVWLDMKLDKEVYECRDCGEQWI